MDLGGAIKGVVNGFAKMRRDMIAESKLFSLLGGKLSYSGRRHTSACVECTQYEFKDWSEFRGEQQINFGMAPAPCQCRCSYCTFPHEVAKGELPHENSFNKIFNIVKYARSEGHVSQDARWRITCGEITIYPFKDRIYEMVKDSPVTFFTNCFVYDDKLSAILASNRRASIDFSIDSGTQETWKKVKGVDNFNTAVKNLSRYAESTEFPDLINLKYLILPGVNDNDDDYNGVITLMKKLRIKRLELAYDLHIPCNTGFSSRDDLFESSSRLAALLQKNDMPVLFYQRGYSTEDQEKVKQYADELVRCGAV